MEDLRESAKGGARKKKTERKNDAREHYFKFIGEIVTFAPRIPSPL